MYHNSMGLLFNGSVMKVGNSLVVVLPKPITDNFGIEKGDTIKMVVTDKGIYIPLSQKASTKEIEKIMKEMQNK